MEPDHHRDGQEDDFWYHIDFVGADGIGVDERVGIELGSSGVELNSALRMGRNFVMERVCNDE